MESRRTLVFLLFLVVRSSRGRSSLVGVPPRRQPTGQLCGRHQSSVSYAATVADFFNMSAANKGGNLNRIITRQTLILYMAGGRRDSAGCKSGIQQQQESGMQQTDCAAKHDLVTFSSSWIWPGSFRVIYCPSSVWKISEVSCYERRASASAFRRLASSASATDQ